MKVRPLLLALSIVTTVVALIPSPSQSAPIEAPHHHQTPIAVSAFDQPVQQDKYDALAGQRAIRTPEAASRAQARPSLQPRVVSRPKPTAVPAQPPQPVVTTVAGCTDADWRSTLTPEESWIIQRESDFDPTSRNPSGAYGLGQLKPYNQIASYGIDNPSPCVQLVEMRHYISERYGTESKAQSFWRQHGWY